MLLLLIFIGCTKEFKSTFLYKGNTLVSEKRSDLLKASRKGSLSDIVRLIADGEDIDKIGENGLTPLIVAGWNSHKEVVKLLLKKGAAIDAKNKSELTPLYIASQKGHKEVVELLLTKGAAIDLSNKNGTTPLCIASRNGHVEVVRLLLRKGADVNKIKSTGENMMTFALDSFQITIIEELISTCFVEGKGIVLSPNSFRVDENILNSFQRIITWPDNIRRSRFSIRKGFQPDNPATSFAKIYRILNEIYIEQFFQAFENDLKKSSSVEFVEIIDKIRALKEINKSEVEKIDSIISDVSKRSRYEIVDFLDKLFDTRRVLKESPIYDEFRNNREAILNRRVKAGYYKDYTILMIEILKGNLDRVKKLIKEGSDVNASNQSGKTCLMLAVEKNFKEIVELLISSEVDINAVNKSGENALMIAIEANSVEMVKILSPKSEIGHEDIFENTLLILAIKKGMYINSRSSDSEKRFKDIEDIISVLLENGSQVIEKAKNLLKDEKEDEAAENFLIRLVRILRL